MHHISVLKNGGELITEETGFYHIFSKDGLKSAATSSNLKVTNNCVTNCSRITHLANTNNKWVDINISHVVGLPKGTSITLEINTGILNGGIFSLFMIMNL